MILLVTVVLFIYVFVTLFGHIVHWALHQPWMGRFNRSHMRHHLILYPPDDYYSDSYRDAGKDSTTKFFVAISAPVISVLILILSMVGLPLSLIIFALCEVALLGWLHDYVHDAFHISNHWLRKYSLFKKLDRLHFNHHVDMSKNFGIYVFHWDKLFKTFKK